MHLRLQWLLPALVLLVGLSCSTAHARFSMAVSVGQGYRLSQERGVDSTNVLVAPGLSLAGDYVRLELGVASRWSHVAQRDSTDLQLELRPMLIVGAPLFPVYGRVIMAAIDPFKDERQLAYGGAVGIKGSLLGLGLFAEAGALPRSVSGEMIWVAEGRLGAYYLF